MSGAFPQRPPRVRFDAPVMLSGFGFETLAHARDLSEGGIYLELERPPTVSSMVRLSFDLPGHEGRIVANGTVVRANPPREAEHRETEHCGAAVRFDALGGHQLATLRDFIAATPSDIVPPTLWAQFETGPPLLTRVTDDGDSWLLACDLPKFRIGSRVELRASRGEPAETGTLRWVAVDVPAGSDRPRLTLGVEAGEATTERPLFDSEAFDHEVLQFQDETTLVEDPKLISISHDTLEDPPTRASSATASEPPHVGRARVGRARVGRASGESWWPDERTRLVDVGARGKHGWRLVAGLAAAALVVAAALGLVLLR